MTGIWWIKSAGKRVVQGEMKKGSRKDKYARLEEWGMQDVEVNSFLHSGLEGVTRGMDISNRARPKSSKAEKDLERAGWTRLLRFTRSP